LGQRFQNGTREDSILFNNQFNDTCKIKTAKYTYSMNDFV